MRPGRFLASFIAVVAVGLTYADAGNGAHTLIKMYVASGNPGTAIVHGDNLIDSQNVRCPKGLTTCTLVLSVMDELCPPGIIAWQIHVTVDDAAVDTGVDQPRGGDGGCLAGNWVGNFVVASGAHHVKAYTFMSDNFDGGTQGQWSVNYGVTTP